MRTILQPLAIGCLITCTGLSWGAAGTVEFASTHYAMTEGGGVVAITLRIDPPPTTGFAHVTVTHTGGTALGGQNWEFAGGDGTDQYRILRLVDTLGLVARSDSTREADETIELTLSNPTGGYVLGSNAKTTVTIHDPTSSVQFHSDDTLVEHGGPFGTLSRSGDTNGAFSVDYVLNDGTARVGIDYTARSGTITFAPGERLKELAIPNPSIDNRTVDGWRTIFVTLTNVTAGVAFDPTPVEVSIVDNENANNFDRTFSAFGDSRAAPVLCIQRDGKILSAADGKLVRLLSDGTHDASFETTFDGIFACVQQADGKLLVAAENGVFRLHSDGSLDLSFTLDGILAAGGYAVPIPPFPRKYQSAPIIVLPDGGVLILIGDRGNVLKARTLVRLRADGKLDPNFSAENLSPFDLIALQADGKILVLATSTTSPGNTGELKRLDSVGRIDPDFIPPTFTYQNPEPGFNPILIQPDQKILVSGYFEFVNGLGRTNLVRLFPDGSVDEAFLAPAVTTSTRPLLLPDGDFLCPSTDSRELIWLKANGSFVRRLPLGLLPRASLSQSPAFYLQPDGRLLVAGRYESAERSIRIPSGYWGLFSVGIARFNLADTDKPGVEFAADHLCVPGDPTCNAYQVEWLESENLPSLRRLLRLGHTIDPLTVTLRTSGSATPGEDYFTLDSPVAFAPGEVERDLSVRILDDAIAENDEDIVLTLVDPAGVTATGSRFILRILDDEPSRSFTSGPTLFSQDDQTYEVELNFNAPVDESWHVEVSTDLTIWSRADLSGVSSPRSVRRLWQDLEVGSHPTAFYRAVKD